jgi:hypothetical protein
MSIGNETNVYDEDGYNAEGWDCEGIHRDTGNEFDEDGYTVSGEKYNDEGYDVDGYNEDGWNEDGINRDTGTEFNESGYTESGDEYDSEGYDSGGYDSEGYDSNGEDSDGNTREDNERSEQGEEFDNQLVDYGGDVLEICEWRQRPGQDKELLAGHEIEMYSDEVDIDDVGLVGSQLWKAYRQHNPQADGCAIGKHDGSLDDNGPGGFETVTVPLTREQTYGVFESFDVLGKGRCSAWDKGPEVGHHIHVSRSAISGLTLGKLGVFMNLPANRKFLTAIAQRPPIYNDFEEGKRLSKPKNLARHSVLNLTEHTVEFRLFKSNLKTRCILKNYEFCIAAIKFCRSTSHQNLNRLDFLRFVAANRKEFGYLHTFLMNQETYAETYRSCLPANVAYPKEKGKKPAINVSTGV